MTFSHALVVMAAVALYLILAVLALLLFATYYTLMVPIILLFSLLAVFGIDSAVEALLSLLVMPFKVGHLLLGP